MSKVDFNKLENYLEQFGYPRNIMMKEDSFDIPELSIYEYFLAKANKHLNTIALDFYGKEIDYSELIKRIDSTSEFLFENGIREGDRVLTLLPNIPETMYLQYALNRIGAIVDHADPRSNPTLVEGFVEKEKIKAIAVADVLYDKSIKPIEKTLSEKYNICTVFIVPVTGSLDFFKKMVTRLINNKKQKTFSSEYLDIINLKISKTIKGLDIASTFKKNTIAVIVHSSGTTQSIPKAIPLTNENINSFVEKHLPTEFASLKPGWKILHILPFFAAYGSINSCHLSLCLGLTNIEIPEFDFQDFGLLVAKHHPNIILGVPSWFITMKNDDRVADIDLSNLQMAIVGGDSISIPDEQAINKYLLDHKSNCVITKGHGMSELSGSGTFTFAGHNALGKIGIPFPYDKYIVMDSKKEIVPLTDKGVTGEIWIYSPSATSGELDGVRFAETIDINGFSFIRSKDTMHIDADYEIAFEEREDRTFTRFDGYKVYPVNIERIICGFPEVEDCLVSSYEDNEKYGKLPIAHIVLKKPNTSVEEKKQLIEEIANTFLIRNDITSRDIPVKWKFRNCIPVTKMYKKDFKKVSSEALDGSEFSVSINESNLLLKGIQVIKPKK